VAVRTSTCARPWAAPARPSAPATTRQPARQRQAAEKGCDQVVWLDAVERRWVEEMGGMNLFFVLDGGTGLMTPR
jgi:branched-subunit amino acid aminotransferase/4-amino-4-deoxychorismate lyase